MKLRTIIIDDEKAATESLNLILEEFCPTLEVIASTNSAIEGLRMINDLKPDLVFLDIQMPSLNGFDVIKGASHSCNVILTSAHNHFATEAFSIGAENYLLKPLSIQKVVKAVNKIANVNKELGMEKILSLINPNKKKGRMRVQCSGHTEYVEQKDILYFKAELGCVEIHLSKKRIVSTSPLSHLLEEAGEDFVQIHKSYVININHVARFYSKTMNVQLINDIELPVSRRKKDAFLQILDNRL
jgi:two-component system LytT family response regulator